MVKYTYTAYGEVTKAKASGLTTDEEELASELMEENIILYKGYVYDNVSHLFYCNSSYYSPELCRWISPDSIDYLDPESINGLNLYCYCADNPIRITYYNLNYEKSIDNLLNNIVIPDFKITESKTFISVHWQNDILTTDFPSFFVFSKTKVALLDWSLSFYKGTLYFDKNENYSIYTGTGNVSAFIGYNVEKEKYGVFADANLLSVGFEGRYIDAGISVAGVGFILGWEDKKFRFKIDPPGFFGFDISIDFGQIFKDIFGWEW